MARIIITDKAGLEAKGALICDNPIPDTEFNEDTQRYDLVEIMFKKLVLPNGMEFDLEDGEEISILFAPGYESINFLYLRSWLITGYIMHRFID